MVLYFTQSRGTSSHLRLERSLEWLILDPQAHPIPPDPARLAPFLGTYVANFGPFQDTGFRVVEVDGFLAVEVPGRFITELRDPDEEGRWASVLIDRLSVSFDRDAAGEVAALRWREGGDEFLLPRAVVPAGGAQAEAMEALLARYAGRYHDPDAGQDVTVVIHQGGLAVDVPGTGLVELEGPDQEGLFRVRLNPAVRIRFDEGPEGEILSYTALTPDGSAYVRPRIGGW